MERKKIESFIISTNSIDFYLDADILNEKFKEATFYIKPSKYDIFKISESAMFINPNSEFNMTSMPSWAKIIDKGKISILESTELEKIIEFSGDKLKQIFIAKRENENSDFWTLTKK